MNPLPLHPALRRVVDVLEELGVRYMVCGSLASSRHGEPRSTYDFDLVADIAMAHASLLAAALAPDFYVDELLVEDAVRHRSSFNVVHLASGMKIDVFTLRNRVFSRIELARAQSIPTADGGPIMMATAEDTLLTKLEWYRKTDERSDRQWRDALGIVAQQGGSLDADYCRREADALGVRDLLDRALDSVPR